MFKFRPKGPREPRDDPWCQTNLAEHFIKRLSEKVVMSGTKTFKIRIDRFSEWKPRQPDKHFKIKQKYIIIDYIHLTGH